MYQNTHNEINYPDPTGNPQVCERGSYITSYLKGVFIVILPSFFLKPIKDSLLCVHACVHVLLRVAVSSVPGRTWLIQFSKDGTIKGGIVELAQRSCVYTLPSTSFQELL